MAIEYIDPTFLRRYSIINGVNPPPNAKEILYATEIPDILILAGKKVAYT
ncbi:hypothetical protein [Francisella sp. 19X1-34]|nr:hypothetical protein [Francisella sp. 19X1-34]MED7789636.1 hypothetical protein [Francisella sp. 19X1-34]